VTLSVYRYPLDVTDEQTVEMPAGAQILTVARGEGSRRVMLGVGSHEPVEMWALVDPQAPLQKRRFRIAGTGHSLDDVDTLDFLGSVQLAGGQHVLNVFEDLGDASHR
jgi:hypothetical protein